MAADEPNWSREDIRRVVQRREPRQIPIPGLRPAAVLVALFPAAPLGCTNVWLMRRPDDGSAHGGQVALPGGKHDPEDPDLRSTALREAREEIGLDEAQVDVFGPLDEYVTVTRFCVRPFVGWVDAGFVPRANPMEAVRVFGAPLAVFFGTPEIHSVRVGPFRRGMPSHRVDGETVWGATFTILHRFAKLLRDG